MKKGVFILIVFMTSPGVNAQLIKMPVIIESRIHTGMIIPFYPALSYLSKDDIYALDISVGFPADGKDFWDVLYHKPVHGFGSSVWNLGNNEVFGKGYSVYAFINIPFYKRTGRFSLNYQVSLGAAYMSKRFDIYENNLNRAIGSHLNTYVRLSVDGKIKLNPNCDMIIEAGGTHFSNGKTKSPNYGINAGSVSLGINYLFGTKTADMPDPEIPTIEHKYIQSITYSAGSKVFDNLSGKKYFVTSASYNAEYLISQRRRLGLGADFFYDGSTSEALASSEGIPERDFTKLIRFGLHSSYTARYKKILAGLQIGHYLYSKYTILTKVYSKLSVQYLITNNITGFVSLKSHFGKADCLEWGMGYYW